MNNAFEHWKTVLAEGRTARSREERKIAGNTVIYRKTQPDLPYEFAITFHATRILEIFENTGHDAHLFAESGSKVLVTSNACSRTTRERLSEYMGGDFRAVQRKSEPFLYMNCGSHEGVNFIPADFVLPLSIHMNSWGASNVNTWTGWEVTPLILHLNLRCQLGDTEANDKLTSIFQSRGWFAMAEMLASYRGHRFGNTTKESLLRALHNLPPDVEVEGPGPDRAMMRACL